jgi:hypothetical protein
MSQILENALDSLRMGVRHYLDAGLQTRDKWAILELFHAIELLLKERLGQEHPLLIYRYIDRPVSPDAQTVGFHETLARFANLNVALPQEYLKILRDLQRRRNMIEHHRFAPDASHRQVLGEALKFIVYFLREHLGEDVEDHLPPELFSQVKELIFEYEELLQRAKASMDAACSRFKFKEQSQFETASCPECRNETVLIGPTDEPFCHFCKETVTVRRCEECGTYLSPDELTWADMCRDCLAYKLDRD